MAIAALPTTTTTTHLLLRTRFAAPSAARVAAVTAPARRSPFARRASAAPIAMAASSSPAVEMWVKGDPKTETLLDCPFSHRALLTAAHKSVPLKRGYIDFAAKPDWLLQVNPKGAVPVMKVLESGEWIVGSDVISDWLEDKFPEPKMGHTGEAPGAGGDVFPAFVAFLKAPEDGSEDTASKETALNTALVALAAYLKDNGDAFLGPGPGFGAGDAALAPKLHHMSVALPHFKKAGWSLPAGAEGVGAYMARVAALPAWAACAYSDDAVIAGWERHLAQH